MSEVEIRLDKNKPYSLNTGQMTPDDPHFNVAYWQGEKVSGKMVLLPFDANGNLVPDDGRTEPWMGVDADGKQVKYFPLWNNDRRALLKKRIDRAGKALVQNSVEEDEEDTVDSLASEVNFAMFLRGQANYPWTLLRAAAKRQFSVNFTSNKQLVEDLVLDFNVVPAAEVCQDLRRYLPSDAA